MLLEFAPFRWQDLWSIPIQAEHEDTYAFALTMGEALEVAEGPYSWTAWNEQGVAVAACGINRGEAWAFMSGDLKKYLIPVTRRVQKALRDHHKAEGPVVATIDNEYTPAVRWAKILGFRRHDGPHWIYPGIL